MTCTVQNDMCMNIFLFSCMVGYDTSILCNEAKAVITVAQEYIVFRAKTLCFKQFTFQNFKFIYIDTPLSRCTNSLLSKVVHVYALSTRKYFIDCSFRDITQRAITTEQLFNVYCSNIHRFEQYQFVVTLFIVLLFRKRLQFSRYLLIKM